MSKRQVAPASPPRIPAARRPAVRLASVAERPDRKLAILLAAERLFAQVGYHGVTIRQIAEEAGVPLALVGYHFGPKDALFYAIFAHWSATIDERLAALREVSRDPHDPLTLPRMIAAFVEPVIRLRASPEGEFYGLLVGRELSHAVKESDRVLRDFFDPLADAFIGALNEAFPQATRAQVAWCYQFALGALLHHLSDQRIERLSAGTARANEPAGAAQLIRFLVGGIRAALPPPKTPSRPATSRRAPAPSRQRTPASR